MQVLDDRRASEEDLLDIARLALAEYDLPAESELRSLSLTNNAVFEIVTPRASERDRADHLVLRVHRPAYKTSAQIRSELQFVQTLAAELQDTRIDVPRSVATSSGDLPGEDQRAFFRLDAELVHRRREI